MPESVSRRPAFRLVALGIALFCDAAPAQTPEPGFEPLFDGRTLDGWSGDPAHWTVEDGAIVGRSTADAPLARNTFLIGATDAADFVLRLRFAIEGGNSGVQYRCRDLGD